MAKRKNKLKSKKPEIEEMSGFKLGQMIYCNRYPDGKLSYGRIEMFHPAQKVEKQSLSSTSLQTNIG